MRRESTNSRTLMEEENTTTVNRLCLCTGVVETVE